jgi:hypothetical protein
MQIAVLGIDLGKNSCSVVGLDASGRVVLRRRLQREGVVKLAADLPGCVMAMEACCGAHHLGRRLRDQGHQVRLMSPEYVRPYVKAQKNDDRDAEAIAEAATRPTMRFVELKSETQLDMQSLHRARDRLVGERTALINQLRAFLLERGVIVPQGRRKLELQLETLLAGKEASLSPRTRLLIEDQRAEWRELDRRIETFDDEFARTATIVLPRCWTSAAPSGSTLCSVWRRPPRSTGTSQRWTRAPPPGTPPCQAATSCAATRSFLTAPAAGAGSSASSPVSRPDRRAPTRASWSPTSPAARHGGSTRTCTARGDRRKII